MKSFVDGLIATPVITKTTTGAIVSASTMMTWILNKFEWFVGNITVIAAITGLVLSIVLIYVNIVKSIRDGRSRDLEQQIMEHQINKLKHKNLSNIQGV